MRVWGWGAAVNHGVDEELVERVFAQNRAFFALPAEQKRLILADCNNRRARHARARFVALVPVPRVETERGVATFFYFPFGRYTNMKDIGSQTCIIQPPLRTTQNRLSTAAGCASRAGKVRTSLLS